MKKSVNGVIVDMEEAEVKELQEVQIVVKPLTKEEREAKEKADAIALKYAGIEKHIYSFYSEKKQSQDTKWADSYTTKLKASGVEDLELKIVNKAKAFFLGGTLEEMLEDVADEQKPYFEKLIKVAIRTEWAELCIVEGVKAIQEDREPKYPPFPNI